MKPDAMMVRVEALRVARLGGMRSPEQVDILGEQIAAAITTALSERDAAWRAKLEDAEALAADLRQRLDGQRAGHCKTIESRDEWWRKCQQAERQRDEAFQAATEALDADLAADSPAEAIRALRNGLHRIRLLAAHPEPAERHYQRHQPCGCVVCICADENQCHRCGATACAEYPSCVSRYVYEPAEQAATDEEPKP